MKRLPLFLAVFDRLVAEDKDLVGVIPAALRFIRIDHSMVGLRPMRVVHGKSQE